MRWPDKELLLESRYGESRTVRKFLWFPRCLPDTKHREEWRWLEHADVIQQVCKIDVGGSGEWGHYAFKWCDMSWEG